jgi:rare lipoprotein A
MLRLIGAVVVCALTALAACAGGQTAPSAVPSPQAGPVPLIAPSPQVGPVPLIAPTPDQIYRETGIASWYGKEFHGNKTASGEVFDMNGFSAAHRTLPFGTTIRVTNLDNFKSIKVTINDRGPSDKGEAWTFHTARPKSLASWRRASLG